MGTRREDRETLRELAHVCMTGKNTGYTATYVYTLISHMRGKLHMRWYKKRHGGWQAGFKGRELEFNTTDGHFCPGARIASLEDQTEWLRLNMRDFCDMDLAMRVLKGYPFEDASCPAPIAQVAMRAE